MRSAARSLGATSLVLVSLTSLVAAQVPSGSSVTFAYPPRATPPLTINHLDSVVVQWTSTYDSAWLWLFCNTSTEGNFGMVYAEGVSTSGSLLYSAKAQEQFANRKDWTAPLLCHFDLNFKNENGKGFNGPGMSVISLAGKAEATTHSLGGAKTSSVRSTLGTASRATSTTRTASSSPTSSSGSGGGGGGGISGGAIAGIVIGAIAGIIAVAAVVFLLLRNHRKMKEIESKIPREQGTQGYEGKPLGVAVGPSYHEVPQSQPYDAAATTKYAHQTTPMSPRELEPTAPPQELPGSIVQPTSVPQEPGRSK